jgi:hypothetical protein
MVLLLGVLGCTRPNPRDCADGLCSDPAFPCCDVDGALEGEAKTCVAVACTAGDFRACRGDTSIVCNATGNDYDLVACELGCDATHGCRACVSADDCANPTPVCDDATVSCRACRADDECPSLVCEEGSCANQAGILYAKANGSDASDCSLAQPCTMYHAQNLALAAAVPPIIRLLPGVYAVGIMVSTPTSAPLRFVASGATVAAQTAVRVSDGANVKIRGLTATGTSGTVICESTVTARSTLSLTSAVVTVSDAGSTLVNIGKCDLSLFASELNIGASTGASVGIFNVDGASFAADRVHFHGANPSRIGTALATRVSVRITNSLLENVSLQWSTNDSGPPGSLITMGFNTILMDQDSLYCVTNSGSAYRTTYYENNIVVATNVTTVVNGTSCTLAHNVLLPYTDAAGSNTVADPQFVDGPAKDYHLKPASPAIDAAVPSASVLATPDFDGVTRPQGPQPDIGAFERLP